MKQKTAYARAIGLEYDDGQDEVPRVNVKGEGEIADKVVALARRYGVPVVERPELAKMLSQLDLHESVPEELFQAVAVVLAELQTR